MPPLDLTPFGFTPTESLVYRVLLTGGPGTGYAIARAAGLARANAYSALEGLVTKGAARAEDGRPKRFRPEPPATLLGQIIERQGNAIDELSAALASAGVPSSPTLVEIHSPRAALQLIAHEVARASQSVMMLAPADAYPVLTPALRRAHSNGVGLALSATAPTTLSFTEVQTVTPGARWPFEPLLMVVDRRSAVIASRDGDQVSGHWGSAATLVAAATLAIRDLQRHDE